MLLLLLHDTELQNIFIIIGIDASLQIMRYNIVTVLSEA